MKISGFPKRIIASSSASAQDAIINWRRFLKRRNCSPNTVKNYLNALKHFVIWLDVPIEDVTHTNVSWYIDYLMAKRLKPKTINCHLNSIRQFYHYLREDEHMQIPNPIRKNHVIFNSRQILFFEAFRKTQMNRIQMTAKVLQHDPELLLHGGGCESLRFFIALNPKKRDYSGTK
ncbi:MAG: phage integrase N-terminal SAM-like domain-containing protein [Proteobacteria bacterium]|nr:phage integrase N-terminal SAM-like domain-containing protein [Pseudomonadota bacterium]